MLEGIGHMGLIIAYALVSIARSIMSLSCPDRTFTSNSEKCLEADASFAIETQLNNHQSTDSGVYL
jgi:hypothetical protein